MNSDTFTPEPEEFFKASLWLDEELRKRGFEPKAVELAKALLWEEYRALCSNPAIGITAMDMAKRILESLTQNSQKS